MNHDQNHHEPDQHVWTGIQDGGCYPPAGRHFVYLLLSEADHLLYVGRSDALERRLRRHAANKPFHRWVALQVPDFTAAVSLEAVVIATMRPILNVKGQSSGRA